MWWCVRTVSLGWYSCWCSSYVQWDTKLDAKIAQALCLLMPSRVNLFRFQGCFPQGLSSDGEILWNEDGSLTHLHLTILVVSKVV